jgi:excisionase family DNA binding protein
VAYRPREVAEMVGMPESGIRNLIRRGTLRAVRLDGRWLIPAAAIEDKLGVQLDASIAVDAPPSRRRRAGGRASSSVVRPEAGDAQSSYWGVLFTKTILPSRVML